MKKISTKIIVAILICMVGLSTAVTAVAVWQSNRMLMDVLTDNLEETAQNNAYKLSMEAERIENVVLGMVDSITATLDVNRLNDAVYMNSYQHDVMEPLVSEFAASVPEVAGTYFEIDPVMNNYLAPNDEVHGAWFTDSDKDGEYTRESMEKKKDFQPDSDNFAWFYDTVKAGKGVWTLPYEDFLTKVYSVSYTEPVIKSNKTVGVAGIDLFFERFSKPVQDVKLFKTGYAFLLSPDFYYLSHPTLKQEENLLNIEGGKYKYIAEAVKNKEHGVISADFGGKKKILAFAKMTNGNIFFVAVPREEMQA